MKRITITDVAKKVGVSKSTVSAVLNAKNTPIKISPETIKRVREAVETMGFVPDEFARGLRGKRTTILGVIVFDIKDPYCTQIIQGIQNITALNTYGPLLLVDMQNNDERIKNCIENLSYKRIDGLAIIARSIGVIDDIVSMKHKLNIPMAVLGINMEKYNIPSVIVDNEQGATEAINHLITLRHKKIGIITDSLNVFDSNEREKGVNKVWNGYKAKGKQKIIFRRPPSISDDFQVGYKAVKEWIEKGESFTAIFTFGDLFAYGAIAAFKESGLKVPEDVSVVGFDDLEISKYCEPQLTTIRQPLIEMGEKAGEMLINNSLKKESMPESSIIFQPQFVLRKSTAKIKK